MPGVEGLAAISSPLGANASKEDTIAYYKEQYEQLELELADFQESSRELEAELEKEAAAAEVRERKLAEKVEALRFEADEWKSKCKQSKVEANLAQNGLQKEITTLRDTNRTLQLKLRDIEVQNDDFERQARNTTSSLEDLESKYNTALERSVLLEEEVRAGEQERETLRIEVQRLRDELSDLRVEAEIRQGKLRHAEAVAERSRLRKTTLVSATVSRPHSSFSQHSPTTTASSPGIATPPSKSVSSSTSDNATSPPTSSNSQPNGMVAPTGGLQKTHLSIKNVVTPRPGPYASRPPRHSRGPSIPSASSVASSSTRRTNHSRLDRAPERPGIAPSASLTQIRGLIGKMQRLEQRVHNARSKLPAAANTPPRGSPRPGSCLSQVHIPSSVTVRSSRKRVSPSTTSTTASSVIRTESEFSDTPAAFTRPSSRLSFGMPTPTPNGMYKATSLSPRPSSRPSISNLHSMMQAPPPPSGQRPSSRQSTNGGRPAGSAYPHERARPLSSAAGSYAHSRTSSVHGRSDYGVDEASLDEEDFTLPTPTNMKRRSIVGLAAHAREPTLALPKSHARRTSMTVLPRRTSRGPDGRPATGEMGPPPARKKLSGVGETY